MACRRLPCPRAEWRRQLEEEGLILTMMTFRLVWTAYGDERVTMMLFVFLEQSAMDRCQIELMTRLDQVRSTT